MPEHRTRQWIGIAILVPVVLLSLQLVSVTGGSVAPDAVTWSQPANLSNTEASSFRPLLAIDGEDTVHAVWGDQSTGTSDVYYASKPAGGSWSSPANVSGSPVHVSPIALAVDDWGTLHLLWERFPEIFYLAKPHGGAWTAPVLLHSGTTSHWQLVATGNTLHAVWEQYVSCSEQEINYVTMTLGGAWSAPANISQRAGGSNACTLAVDETGTLHVAWLDHSAISPHEMLYLSKPSGGAWTPATTVPGTFNAETLPTLAAGAAGTVHLAWPMPDPPVGGGVYHTILTPGDGWREPELVDPTWYSGKTAMACDQEHRVHLLWMGREAIPPMGEYHPLRYATWDEDGWSPASNIPGIGEDGSLDGILALDGAGLPHVAWSKGVEDVYYTHALDAPEPAPEPVSGTIPPEGGTLVQHYPGHTTRFEVPPGAISASGVFTISYHAPPPIPGSLAGLDHFFDLEGTETVFSLPVTVTVVYSDRGTLIPGTEALYWFQGNRWVTGGLTLTQRWPNGLAAELTHLSLFGVLGETNRAYLPVLFRH